MGLRFISGGATDVGQVREVNEDAFALVDQECTWILADGMGGHVGGKVASNLAVDAIRDFFTRWRHAPGFEWPFEIMPGRSFACMSSAFQMAMSAALSAKPRASTSSSSPGLIA